MIGLILKDFYSLRSYLLRQMGLMALVFLCIGFFLKSFSFLSPMLVLVVMMSMISSISVDDSAHWNSYALTLPVSAEQIVGAKYVVFIGGMCATGVLGTAVCALCDALTFHEGARAIIFNTAAVLLVYYLVCCLALPMLIHFGAEKGRIYMTLIFMIPFLAFVFGSQFFDSMTTLPEPSSTQIFFYCVIALFVCAILGVISYSVSVKLFRAKEY